MALGYKSIKEPSVYVKFRLMGEHNTSILAWTTTPWTLPGNVALAVAPDVTYVKIKQGKENFILAKDLLEQAVEGDYKIVEEYKGKNLSGLQYEPLFDSLKDASEKKHYVTETDFVTTQEGTGVVHTAVMYGVDDYNLGEKLDLPKIHTVNDDGTFNERVRE